MKVRYNKKYGIGLVIMGVLILALNLHNLNQTFLFTPLVLILAGILFIKRTYFILEEKRLILNALIGPFKRTYDL